MFKIQNVLVSPRIYVTFSLIFFGIFVNSVYTQSNQKDSKISETGQSYLEKEQIKPVAFPDQKSGDEELNTLFKEAVEAVGQRKIINKFRSIEVAADCAGPRGNYTTEIVSYGNGKTIFRQRFNNREPVNIFINGDTGWTKSAQTGEYSIISPVEKSIARGHEFQLMAFDFQKMFSDFSMAGTEIFENKPSIKVLAKNDLGNPIHLFFDAETKLLAGYVLPIPQSNETVKIVFKEWKSIRKLKLPSIVMATDKSGEFVLRFHTIKLNELDSKTSDISPRLDDLKELLRLHEQQKTAHLTYNAELLVGESEDQPTVVQRGSVSTNTRSKNLAGFKSYFARSKFIEWEDIKPPVIRISNDGTMATVIVQKRVRRTYKNEQGQEKLDHTEFAWLEVWDKKEGLWQLVTIASTEKILEDSNIENKN